MEEQHNITILYDAAENVEKASAVKEGKPFPLTYAQVTDALEKRGHKINAIPVTKKIRSLVSVIEKDDSDVIFNLCEDIAGSTQHEHNIVGLLELFEKCFTGSGSAGWMLAGDKALCKKLFQFHGIRYPSFCTFDSGKVEWSDELAFPVIVKPLHEDASQGIDKGSVVHNIKELLERVSLLHEKFGGATLIEEFIEGREIYVGVLGNGKPQAFPILEWDFSKVTEGPKIAGSEAKWDPDSEGYKAPEVFPEDIPNDVVQDIQAAAITAFHALKLTGYARVDMRLRKRSIPANESVSCQPVSEVDHPDPTDEIAPDKPRDKQNGASRTSNSPGTKASDKLAPVWEPFIIEVNPNCWLEKRSEFAMAARKHGLSYPDLLENILQLALERRSRPRWNADPSER